MGIRPRAARFAAGILSAWAIAVAAGAGRARPVRAQVVEESYRPAEGTLRIGTEPDRVISATAVGHTLLLPDRARPTGIVVFFDARRFEGWSEPEPGGFDRAALDVGLGILHLTTGDPLDFFFTDARLDSVAERIASILAARDLAGIPVGFAGLSLGGTRALRMAAHLRSRQEGARLALRGVAVVDAPLDFVRVWESATRTRRRDVSPVAVDEARWVQYLLASNLGGTPFAAREAYVRYSPYTATEPGGGNARYLVGLPLLAYHEPDVDWWIERRGKSYPDMNSVDLAGLVNELRLAGSEEARLVTTHAARDGYDAGASPHTWSIVDDRSLAIWFRDRFAKESGR